MNYFADASLWWLLPIAILSAVLAYWYYFKTKTNALWEGKQLLFLTILRGCGLFILFLLLLGLVWETTNYRKEKPLFVTLIDQSGSMKNGTDSVRLKQQITSFQNELKEAYEDRFEFVDWKIGEQPALFNKLFFTEKESDLAAGFKTINELYFNRNIGGVVLISDGIYNKGNHPMYEAERVEMTPIFCLGTGDTTTQRDVIVRSIQTNEVAFVNNQFPIEATIESNRLPGKQISIQLLEDGKVIQQKSLQNGNGASDQHVVTFSVNAKNKGFHRYTVAAKALANEFTTKNNQQTGYVEIVDNKQYILCLSSGPHPDIAAIRSILEEDEQATVESALTSSFTLSKKTPNLIVWYENGLKPNPALFNEIQRRKIPVWFIAGPTTQPSVITNYNLGFKIAQNGQQEDIYPTANEGFNAFEFTKEFTDATKIYPPLRCRFGAIQLPGNASVVLTQRIGNIQKKDPLMYFSEKQQIRTGVLLGEGIWRWKMKEFVAKQSINGFREFVQKTVQYLTVKGSNEPFRITLPKRFLTTETIEIKAEFYNDAMELITTPEINFSYLKKGGERFTSEFSPNSNFYLNNIGQLEPGSYTWTAIAKHKGKTYKKTGMFVVEDVALEMLETRADFGVLSQLTKQSNGSFYPISAYRSLIKELEKRKDIATLQFADMGYTAMIDWKWLFALLILLFSAEWFLRRFWGGY